MSMQTYLNFIDSHKYTKIQDIRNSIGELKKRYKQIIETDTINKNRVKKLTDFLLKKHNFPENVQIDIKKINSINKFFDYVINVIDNFIPKLDQIDQSKIQSPKTVIKNEFINLQNKYKQNIHERGEIINKRNMNENLPNENNQLLYLQYLYDLSQDIVNLTEIENNIDTIINEILESSGIEELIEQLKKLDIDTLYHIETAQKEKDREDEERKIKQRQNNLKQMLIDSDIRQAIPGLGGGKRKDSLKKKKNKKKYKLTRD